MDAYKKYYRATFVWHRGLAKIMGHDVYDWNFRPGLPTILITILVILSMICICYTMIFYDNFTRLNCILYLGICVQVSSSLTMAID